MDYFSQRKLSANRKETNDGISSHRWHDNEKGEQEMAAFIIVRIWLRARKSATSPFPLYFHLSSISHFMQMSPPVPSASSLLESMCNCTAQLLARQCSGFMAAGGHVKATRLMQTGKAGKAMLERSHQEDLNADLYSAVMLSLFAGVILVLMIRAIKPSESLDDQVNLLLNSMRARCEVDEDERRKVKMREAKRKVQRWLTEAKAKSVRKLSFRSRASTEECQTFKDNSTELAHSHHSLMVTSSSRSFSLMSQLFANSQKSGHQQKRTVSALHLNDCANSEAPKVAQGRKTSQQEQQPISNVGDRHLSAAVAAPEIVITGSGRERAETN